MSQTTRGRTGGREPLAARITLAADPVQNLKGGSNRNPSLSCFGRGREKGNGSPVRVRADAPLPPFPSLRTRSMEDKLPQPHNIKVHKIPAQYDEEWLQKQAFNQKDIALRSGRTCEVVQENYIGLQGCRLCRGCADFGGGCEVVQPDNLTCQKSDEPKAHDAAHPRRLDSSCNLMGLTFSKIMLECEEFNLKFPPPNDRFPGIHQFTHSYRMPSGKPIKGQMLH
ncbi:hypothetical protein B0H16DRAFT_1770151 [Mycena metata]|uniref:Uncharacterized protein n=1 Tax=Mycena metata TaxID=1033252 RepID=A0AAD7I0M5_9AGAR|nr:hypothetical protein B0H16DRAFT_1770151 [Mycena metata]